MFNIIVGCLSPAFRKFIRPEKPCMNVFSRFRIHEGSSPFIHVGMSIFAMVLIVSRPIVSPAPQTYHIMHKFTHLHRRRHTPPVPTQPHTLPTQSPSSPAQPPVIVQPCTVHKRLTTPDMQMPALQWTTINMHLAISHGVCTATAGDILIYPQRRTTACTATSKHESITLARYILATTLYITTCLFTCIHLPHCWHSHHWWHAPIPTLLAQPPVTHAPTTTLFILLSFHPHPAVPTLPYWCGTFLICYYARCGLPKSHLTPDAAFHLHGQSFHILLTFLFPYLHSYFHAMKITWSCLSSPP